MAIKKIDAFIVEQARRGDHEAFSAIFEEYGRPVAGYLYRLLGDREAAGDLSQETFLKAYRGLMKFSPGEIGPDFNLSAWLFTIAHHSAMDHLRRNKRQGSLLSIFNWLEFGRPGHGNEAGGGEQGALAGFGEPGSESLADRVVLGDTVERALGRMPGDHAACLILHYHQGFSYAEAAGILGLPLTTFKMRLYRARQAFQQIYRQEAGPNEYPETPKIKETAAVMLERDGGLYHAG